MLLHFTSQQRLRPERARGCCTPCRHAEPFARDEAASDPGCHRSEEHRGFVAFRQAPLTLPADLQASRPADHTRHRRRRAPGGQDQAGGASIPSPTRCGRPGSSTTWVVGSCAGPTFYAIGLPPAPSPGTSTGRLGARQRSVTRHSRSRHHGSLKSVKFNTDEMFKHPVPFGKLLAQASSLAIPGRP